MSYSKNCQILEISRSSVACSTHSRHTQFNCLVRPAKTRQIAQTPRTRSQQYNSQKQTLKINSSVSTSPREKLQRNNTRPSSPSLVSITWKTACNQCSKSVLTLRSNPECASRSKTWLTSLSAIGNTKYSSWDAMKPTLTASRRSMCQRVANWRKRPRRWPKSLGPRAEDHARTPKSRQLTSIRKRKEVGEANQLLQHLRADLRQPMQSRRACITCYLVWHQTKMMRIIRRKAWVKTRMQPN